MVGQEAARKGPLGTASVLEEQDQRLEDRGGAAGVRGAGWAAWAAWARWMGGVREKACFRVGGGSFVNLHVPERVCDGRLKNRGRS